MSYYIFSTLLIELTMLTMLLHVVHYSGFTKTQKNWFVLTFTSVVICSVAELAVHCGYYNRAFALPLTLLTVVQFSLAPLLAVFFSGALGLHDEARKAARVFALNALVEVVAAPFGLIFYFNDAGYFRGSFFFVYEICYFLAFVYLIVSMIRVGERFRHRDFSTIIMVVVLLLAGIVPMTFYKINITYLSIGICSILCYIYYNDLVQEDIQEELIVNRDKMQRMQVHTISGLANLIESRDADTGGHIARTSQYVKEIAENARALGYYADQLDEHYIALLYTLAPMHDVGKIVVPDRILKKPGKLSAEEYELMKTHAAAGGEIVRQILRGIADEEYIQVAADIAACHHERWDGKGYPRGLRGEDIPLCARIMAIADVFDALISERCYKQAMPFAEAVQVIKSESGSHFDPKLTEAFLAGVTASSAGKAS